MGEVAPDALLDRRAVRLAASATDKLDAVRQCGQALVNCGCVDETYVGGMLERESTMSTYVGEGFAIPHGTEASKAAVRRDALSFVRFPAGVDWDGDQVSVCIGIAAANNGHLSILAALAQILLEPDKAEALRTAETFEDVIRMLASGDDEDDEDAHDSIERAQAQAQGGMSS
jgi:PTS system mannitol-specific IIA component